MTRPLRALLLPPVTAALWVIVRAVAVLDTLHMRQEGNQ